MAPGQAIARQVEDDDGQQLAFPAVPGSARDAGAVVRGDGLALSQALSRRYKDRSSFNIP